MKDSFGSRSVLSVGELSMDFYRLESVPTRSTLPFVLKVMLENLLRNEDGRTITPDQVHAIAEWTPGAQPVELQFTPARVLLQDLSGIPCIMDLVAMRETVSRLGGDPARLRPTAQTDLVIDHSVIADFFGRDDAYALNTALEYERNGERYEVLRWAQDAFPTLRVVPPGNGICHQVNLEYLATVVGLGEVADAATGRRTAYPDTVVGTDSHTTMVNGLGVLGWGVGGIEAESAMLGQPISMLLPTVVGVRLAGRLRPGVTSTDLVLTMAEFLRQHDVVAKFVEFYGPGVAELSLATRATLGNMSPEYGSTCAIFPIDDQTLRYLRLTNRSESRVQLVEAYAKEQGLWSDGSEQPDFNQVLLFDLDDVVPSISGPRRPQDRLPLTAARPLVAELVKATPSGGSSEDGGPIPTVDGALADNKSIGHRLEHGDIAIAAITSCTNTSAPEVMIGAGLLARNANMRGLKRKPWVKTSLAPGSKIVTDYLDRAGLSTELDSLGFQLVGYGCTTCSGNSGPLDAEVSAAIQEHSLKVAAVLSGNRNFEGRIHPEVAMSFLASPPLVVAYSLAGTMDIDLDSEPLGVASNGDPVFLRDIWPTEAEIQHEVERVLSADLYAVGYRDIFVGDSHWDGLRSDSDSFSWRDNSSYIQRPPFFDSMSRELVAPKDIVDARALALFGDSLTTDHISPAGSIKRDSEAGRYLESLGVEPRDFNSYGARRGNHEVMMRGTFAHVRVRNRLAPGTEGGFTTHFPSGEVTSVYAAACRYRDELTPLVVLAGSEYGTGSSRDWAAKGTRMLGVRAVIAQSFERIHRSNLIGMGVLPLQFMDGHSVESLGLNGEEYFDIVGLTGTMKVPETLTVRAVSPNRSVEFPVLVRIDTPAEQDYFRHGGIGPWVIRQALHAA